MPSCSGTRTWLLLWAFLVSACGGSEPQAPLNVLLITLDTTRADHLATYGYFRSTTPNLDRLARRSIVFDRFLAPMATTLPTHTSLFTGTDPLEHGVLANVKHGGRRFVTSQELRSFAELVHEAGYRTAAFVSGAPLKPGSGIEAGFEHFDAPAGPARRARPTTQGARAWLARAGAPFFCWVHYYDPHSPFEPPGDYAGQFQDEPALQAHLEARQFEEGSVRPSGTPIVLPEDINLYDGELAYMDHQIGKLLEAGRKSGWLEQTVVVVVGDHGEGLGQHGVAGHGLTWHEQLHAPFFIAVPGQRHARVDRLVTAADVVPTLLGLLDVPGEEAFLSQASGVDALSVPARPILSLSSERQTTLGTPPQLALTIGRWRYLRNDAGEERLFDLRADPFELDDLANTRPLHLRLMKRWASELERQQAERGARIGAQEGEADADLLRELEALGYVEAVQ